MRLSSFLRQAFLGFLILPSLAFAETLLDRLSPAGQQALMQANQSAQAHPSVTVEHFIYALLEGDDPDVRVLLKNTGVDIELLKKDLAEKIRVLPKIRPGNLPAPGEALKSLISGPATKNLAKLGENLVTTDNVLIAYASTLKEEERAKYRLNVDDMMSQANLQRGRVAPGNVDNTKTPSLNRYTIDMTSLARRGDYPSYEESSEMLNRSREQELRRLLRTLGDEGNIAIISGQGGGRSFMVEELARLTALPVDAQPEALQNKRMVRLNIAEILAGSKMRGDAEERIGGVLKEIAKQKGKTGEIILVIENIEDAMGSGKAGEGLDIAAIISASLERKELSGVIVTASEDEWKKKMEPNKKISSHYTPVYLDTPSKQEMFYILKNKRAEFERRYGVTISDEALIAARDLGKRYLTDLLDPKRSVEALRQSCLIYKDAKKYEPPAITSLLKKERELVAEMDDYSQDSVFAKRARERIQKEIEAIEVKIREARADFRRGAELLTKVQETEEKLKLFVAFIKYVESEKVSNVDLAVYRQNVTQLQTSLVQLRGELTRYQTDYPNLAEQVTKAHVAMHIEEAKKIPITDLLADDKAKLAHMEEELGKRVIGQPEAVKAAADAIRNLRTGFKDPGKPIFLSFEGETGVGKTELAKAIAYVLFGDENAMVREEMEGYKEKHTVSRLLGAPPGYQGADEGGQFTEKVRKRPYAVVLLDEIEEAHPDVRSAFLKAMDEGYIVTAAGLKVDVSNCIFIQTTNVDEKDMISTFTPKYVNRIDVRIRFNNLVEEDLEKVFALQLKPLVKRVAEIAGVELNVTPEVQRRLAEKSKETFGARALKRLINDEITNKLSLAYVTGGENGIHEGDVVTMKLSEDGKQFEFDIVGPGNCGAAAAAMAD